MADSAIVVPPGWTTPFVLVSLNPDGVSLARPPEDHLPASSTGPVVSKDVTLDSANGTWLRIYRPPQQQHQQPEQPLPLVVFFHGGGFIVFSAAMDAYHLFCESMAAALPAVVISVEFRLAPEHRLPAAYDDAVATLRWLHGQAAAAGGEDELLRGVDYSRCFLMGSSCGGNIVFHAGRWAVAEADSLLPLRVAGHVYNQTYFGGVERTASELDMENDAVVPLRANDLMWELALPKGADRGHEFCNPAARKEAKEGAAAVAQLPRSLVVGTVGDPLIDREREFAAMLRAEGVEVVERLDHEGFHAVELFYPDTAVALFDDVRAFIYPK